MVMLRTPKGLDPIDYGLPALTPQAWYEACYGAKAWEELDKIPRGVWMEYLRWYRQRTCSTCPCATRPKWSASCRSMAASIV